MAAANRFVFVWSLALLRLSSARPDGAPLEACQDMVPRHGPHQPRTDPCPFVTHPQQSEIDSASSLKVTLHPSDRGDHFAGYLTEALAGEGSGVPIGTFQNAGGRVTSCPSAGVGELNNTATHADNESKTSVELIWSPPRDFDGNVTFKTTFVRETGDFWVAVPAVEQVRVRRADIADLADAAEVSDVTASATDAGEASSEPPTEAPAPAAAEPTVTLNENGEPVGETTTVSASSSVAFALYSVVLVTTAFVFML